jgi:S1-C subfamily serine protease
VRRVALLLVAFGVALTSCGADSNTATTGTLDTSTIVEATLRVRASGCGPRTGLGTGTSIGDGLVVTAAHVVGGATEVELVDHRGEVTPADVVWFDPALDVAALRPVVAPSRSVVLRDTPAAEGDSGMIAIPSADNSIELREIEVEQRATILTTDIYRDTDVRRPGLRIAATVEPGNSGAMVHLPDGGVGIVWSRSAERADQAWTVDLPDELVQRKTRSELVEPVDIGPCP